MLRAARISAVVKLGPPSSPPLPFVLVRSFGLRVVEAVVVVLALYALVALPVGRKTPLQHLMAIFTTPAAKIAAEDVSTTVRRIWAKRSELGRRAPPPASSR